MTTGQLYLHFIKELKGTYPPEEAASLTNWVFEDITGYNLLDIRVMKKDDPLEKEHEQALKSILERLKKQEPVQYILGKSYFHELEIMVNPSVLIPRPETEELVDIILKGHLGKNDHVLDIGTGSGCIPLAIKNAVPGTKVSGFDVSEEAIETARKNAERLRLDVDFFVMDILDQDQWEQIKEPVDHIISNPPYVLEEDKEVMNPNVLEYEPHIALFPPGTDPLIFYDRILTFAGIKLKPNGKVYFEAHKDKIPEIWNLAQKKGFTKVQSHKDLSNKDRYLIISN